MHRWSYTEWQQQLDRLNREEKKKITQETPRDWFSQNAKECRIIYEWAPADSNPGINFLNKAIKLSETQMTKAAYRLAKILNDIFG